MRGRAVRVCCLWVCLGVVAAALAQEGHPLTGTWFGDWGPTATERHRLTVVMNWDGDKVTCVINPGPDSITAANVVVDVSRWTVRIEADAKDAAGAPVHVAAEGRLEDLSSNHRTITGTWRQGASTGAFKITRD